MGKKKQIIRGMFTSLCILFCYTVGITVYFTFPNHYVLYSIFTMISVLLCVFVMFSNNYWINKWIWVAGRILFLWVGLYAVSVVVWVFTSIFILWLDESWRFLAGLICDSILFDLYHTASDCIWSLKNLYSYKIPVLGNFFIKAACHVYLGNLCSYYR